MVGDSLHDLHAGRAAGMRCSGVLTGLRREADLAPHADVVLPHIGHLPDWLAAQGAAGGRRSASPRRGAGKRQRLCRWNGDVVGGASWSSARDVHRTGRGDHT
jgi:hypothetical protein